MPLNKVEFSHTIGSYFYDIAHVVDHVSPIANNKDNSNCQCQLLPSPVTVIFIFLFDEIFMEAGYYFNMLGLVENIRVSLSNTYYLNCWCHRPKPLRVDRLPPWPTSYEHTFARYQSYHANSHMLSSSSHFLFFHANRYPISMKDTV